MTIDHPVRRLLARFCSDDTMATVVDPTLADMRWEGAPWLGYLALVRALALHGVLSIPGVLTRLWCEDHVAVPRMALWTTTAAVLFSLPLIAPAFNAPGVWPAMLLVPQGVAWTLPAVLLLTVPLALRGQALGVRFTRRTIALAMVCVAMTFALILWIAPAADERYRQIVGFSLTGDVEVHQFPQWSAAAPARLLEYQYHQRLAFGFAALPFALLGLGLSTVAAAKRRPWMIGGLAAIAYMFVAFPLELWTAALLLRASSVPSSVLAWGPTLIVLAAAFILLARKTDGPALASELG
jgi:hypothetical protein